MDTPDLEPAQVVQEHGVQTLQSATKRVNNLKMILISTHNILHSNIKEKQKLK